MALLQVPTSKDPRGDEEQQRDVTERYSIYEQLAGLKIAVKPPGAEE